jgi:hypothetical protein
MVVGFNLHLLEFKIIQAHFCDFFLDNILEISFDFTGKV